MSQERTSLPCPFAHMREPSPPETRLAACRPRKLARISAYGPLYFDGLSRGRERPERATASRASDVLDQIRSLLGKHPDCHRIRVETTAGFLFAVDCNGATVFEAL